jgi:filamentous hemagglutinin family protein
VPNPGNVLDSTVVLDWTGSSGLNNVINTATGNNVIGWNNFDIGSNASLTFTQNGGWILNNVQALDGMATGINGGLFAQNCGLIVRNPLGVTFGPASFVSAQNFVATTLSMDIDKFMSQGSAFDPLNFEFGAPGEVGGNIDIQNGWVLGMCGYYWDQAEIEAQKTVALIGRNIYNKGIIRTTQPDAHVLLAAGEKVLLGLQDSKVMVEVTAPNPGDFVVDNGGFWGTDGGTIDAEGGHVVLAAGDIYSTAIEGVETLRATATGTAVFNGPISAYAGPGSDAIAEVEITTGGSLTIDEDITVEAVGNGVDDAYATIDISSGGDLTIKSGEGFMGNPNGEETALVAEATDGANNNAEVSLEAAGAFTIDAPDKVTVKAEADSDCYDGTLNQANVNIKGSSVLITGTDYGITDEPATVKAYAHDAMTNQAAVDIEATEGDVEIIGQGYNGDSAIVMAKARNGSENSANVNIKAADDVKIIAKNGVYNTGDEPTKALVLAKAENADVSNDASVNIEAGGDVKVIGKGGNLYEWQTLNTPEYWTVTVKKDAYYTITVKKHHSGYPGHPAWDEYDTYDTTYWYIRPGWTYVSHETHEAEYYTYDTTNPYWYWDIPCGWKYDSNVYHEATYDDHSSFTPNVAKVLAIAENAGASNTAGVDITAGKDVLVLGKDGGEAKVLAYAGEASDSTNTANVNITAEDGSVKVLAIGGQWSTEDGFTESKASVEAKAEYAGSECEVTGSSNSANVTLIARDIPEEPVDIDSDTDLDVIPADADSDLDADVDNCKDGDVIVLGKDGGKAEVESIAKYGDENSASVDVDADSDVKVIAACKEQPSEAEIMALAKYAHISNTAEVTIAAGDNVEVKAKDRGEAEIEAIAKDGYMNNTATIDIEAGKDVRVIADGWRTEAAISALADPEVIIVDVDDDADSDDDYQGPVNTAGITIAAGDDVKVIADDGEAGITADTSCGQSNTSTIDIAALDAVKVIGKDGGEAEIAADAKRGNTNTADVAIDAGGDVKVIAACHDRSSEASITAEAEKGCENNASVALGGVGHKIGGDVLVLGKYGGDAEIKAKAEKGNTNTADTLVCTEGQLTLLGKYGGDAEIKAKAEKGYSNTASVGIGAVEGVLVKAECGGEAEVLAKAEDGFTNSAETIVCTKGDLIVNALNGGYAGIGSEALDGYNLDAFTGVCATGHVIVGAGFDAENIYYGMPIGGGGEAYIYSEAGSEGCGPALAVDVIEQPTEPSTANARTVAVSKKGSVFVGDFTSGQCYGSAGIEAEAYNAYVNTASVGVAAGSELTPLSAVPPTDDYEGDALGAGNVIVYAYGPWSDARIESYAHDGAENAAETVVCAPGEVYVYAGSYEYGRPIAKIKALAEGEGFNTATTQVYASDVEVDVQGLYRGNGIGAWALGGEEGWLHVDSQYCLTEDGAVAWTDGQSTLIINNYASRKDCPTCPPCPCEEEGGPLTPDAPLYTETGQPLEPLTFEQGGCPALMQWFANEVGLPLDQIHVMLGNADYLATDIQPCDACARLKQQSDAMVMDTSAVDAWASTVRAGLVGPITPEMMDGIRTALADNPAALGFDDAAAEYAKILSEELGFGRDDAVALVTSKYAPDYSDLGAYISARAGM